MPEQSKTTDWSPQNGFHPTAPQPQPVSKTISDEELLARAVNNVRSRYHNKGKKHMRWVAVRDTFGLGSRSSQELCLRFGFDPDEMVAR